MLVPTEVKDKISLHQGRIKHRLVRCKVVCGLKLRAKSCYVFFLLRQHSFEVVLGFTDMLLLFFLSILSSLYTSINQLQIIQLETIP